ncbi:MAG: hypothetical protein MUF18_07660 [Fimbriiglobus sp.]|nr:hypothetical protein [Fimbriiglobus sp.]
MQIPWWGYVILAGLSWGTYVPIIFFGGSELGGKPAARLAAIMCVGVAYLVLAIVIPGLLFLMKAQQWEDVKLTSNGLVFASIAGVMGAVGAICVVFASKEAMGAGSAEYTAEKEALVAKRDAAPEAEKEAIAAQIATLDKEKETYLTKYRILIAPLIFSIAPIVNTLLSSLWDPKPGKWANFEWNSPPPLFWVGILLVAVGTGLVLYSKEQAEQERKKKHQAAHAAPAAPPAAKA